MITKYNIDSKMGRFENVEIDFEDRLAIIDVAETKRLFIPFDTIFVIEEIKEEEKK